MDTRPLDLIRADEGLEVPGLPGISTRKSAGMVSPEEIATLLGDESAGPPSPEAEEEDSGPEAH